VPQAGGTRRRRRRRCADGLRQLEGIDAARCACEVNSRCEW
jgi:hypothetical protein